MSQELAITCISMVFIVVVGFRNMDLKNLIKGNDKILLLPFLLIFLVGRLLALFIGSLINWLTWGGNHE